MQHTLVTYLFDAVKPKLIQLLVLLAHKAHLTLLQLML